MNIYYIIFFIVIVILITLITFTKEAFSEPTNTNNVDHGPNFQYLKNMCIERRINNKEELCNSIVDVVPRPQDKYNPSNFIDF